MIKNDRSPESTTTEPKSQESQQDFSLHQDDALNLASILEKAELTHRQISGGVISSGRRKAMDYPAGKCSGRGEDSAKDEVKPSGRGEDVESFRCIDKPSGRGEDMDSFRRVDKPSG